MRVAVVVIALLAATAGKSAAQYSSNTQSCITAFEAAQRELKPFGMYAINIQALDDDRMVATYHWMQGRAPHLAMFTPDRANERPATEWQQTNLTARRQYANALGTIEYSLRRPTKADRASFDHFYTAFKKAIDTCANVRAIRGG